MSIPIHVVAKQRLPANAEKDAVAKVEYPKDDMCYLFGANGTFMQVKNKFYSIRKKMEKNPKFLATIEEDIDLYVLKLPMAILKYAEGFFEAVYVEHKSEAVVMLYYNSDKEEWKLAVPPQEVSAGSADYDLEKMKLDPEEFKGYEMFGTIHSHASMGAFHSGTDDKDEFQFDGLHITIGNLDRAQKSYSCRWILSTKEFKATLDDCIEGQPNSFDQAWLKKVSKKTYQTGGAYGSQSYGNLSHRSFANDEAWNQSHGMEGGSEVVVHEGGREGVGNNGSRSSSGGMNSPLSLAHPAGTGTTGTGATESNTPTGKYEKVGEFSHILSESEEGPDAKKEKPAGQGSPTQPQVSQKPGTVTGSKEEKPAGTSFLYDAKGQPLTRSTDLNPKPRDAFDVTVVGGKASATVVAGKKSVSGKKAKAAR